MTRLQSRRDGPTPHGIWRLRYKLSLRDLAGKRNRTDCREFRVLRGMMGWKEPLDASTQRTTHSGCPA